MRLIGSHYLQTEYGKFLLYGFQRQSPSEIVVTLKRDNRKSRSRWVVRVQYGCLASTAFHSIDCDCARQLDYSMRLIAKGRRGVIVYFPEREAHGAGLAAKIRMNHIRSHLDAKRLTERAKLVRRQAFEEQELRVVAKVLAALRVRGPFDVLTNNPGKAAALRKAGLEIGSVLHFSVNEQDLSASARREIRAKRDFLDHWKP
jgi:3,4-dihydroxy 2-butanone 4-phosphate synthase / GTP cyclohydrolase II